MPTDGNSSVWNDGHALSVSVKGAADDGRSPLDVLVREGAKRMLQAALESEVQAFVEQHAARVDVQGHRLVGRNEHLLKGMRLD